MVKLAHISDPHLPTCAARLPQLLNKRILGHQSWYHRRKKIHLPEILTALTADIRTFSPDHIAVTGDLTNISLPDEFENARIWLDGLGSADTVTVIPGNHDTYVKMDWKAGPGLWEANMRGDYTVPNLPVGMRFPFVRIRKNVALICLSSAVPTFWFMAAGRIDPEQLKALKTILPRLRSQGFFRTVLVHHPPLPGQNSCRKALLNAAELKDVLAAEGAELVLHGHNHTHMYEEIATATGKAHVFGVPSASGCKTSHLPAAAWNHYNIRRENGIWHCAVTIRGYQQRLGRFEMLRNLHLTFD